MAKLIYSTITSLDGYTEDRNGQFDWAMPDESAHTFINDLERSVGTYWYGRKMYEVMTFWETVNSESDFPAFVLDYAEIWRAAEKIVFSTTLEAASSGRTRIVREFDPAVVRDLKAGSAHDIGIGGPHLAAQAMRAGLVDEYHLFVAPVIVGGGKPWLPADLRLELKLIDERRFANGMVHLHYAAAASGEGGEEISV